jgi:hypothetical protein
MPVVTAALGNLLVEVANYSLDRHRERSFGASDGTVESIAFYRLPTGFFNQTHKLLPTHALRRSSSGIVIDLLFNNGAIDIVRSEAQ